MDTWKTYWDKVITPLIEKEYGIFEEKEDVYKFWVLGVPLMRRKDLKEVMRSHTSSWDTRFVKLCRKELHKTPLMRILFP